MRELTPKQQEVYDYILSFTGEHGYPPSVREIGEAVGMKSPSTVHFHLRGLQKAGALSMAPGKTRAITLSDEHPQSFKAGRVPILGEIAAGAPIPAQVTGDEVLFYDDRSGDEHYALRVRGESMRGAGILPGDLVVFRPQDTARDGDIVVALLEDEATVKTYRRKEGHVWLMPENPDYDPIPGDHARILGKVTACVREY